MLHTVLRPLRLTWRFISATIVIAAKPREVISGVRINSWPGNIGPKAYLSSAIALLLLMSPYSDGERFNWAETVDNMQPADTLAFLHAFSIHPSDFVRWRGVEEWASDSTSMSLAIESRAHSISERDITVYLGTVDSGLARRFSIEAKYEVLLTQLMLLLQKAVTPPLLLMGAVLMYYVCRKPPLTRALALRLASYFIGYYCVLYALFDAVMILIAPAMPRNALSFLGPELLFGTFLAVQFYIYFSEAFECTKLRVTGGLFVAVIGTGIALFAVSTLADALLNDPFMDRLLRRWAGT